MLSHTASYHQRVTDIITYPTCHDSLFSPTQTHTSNFRTLLVLFYKSFECPDQGVSGAQMIGLYRLLAARGEGPYPCSEAMLYVLMS